VKTHFTALDQQLAQTATFQLGYWLQQRETARREQAFNELVQNILEVKSRQELCDRIHQALFEGIGSPCTVIRVVDRCDMGSGEPEEVLDRLFVSDDSHALWPPYRTRADSPISAQVWGEKKTWFSPDLSTDHRLGELPRERRCPRTGCMVVAPMLLGKKEEELVGTLVVHRPKPHTLLKADVKFVERVASLAAVAFWQSADVAHRQPADIETLLVREALHCAATDYFQECADPGSRTDAEERLLLGIKDTLVQGLHGAEGYVWLADEKEGLFRGLAGSASNTGSARNTGAPDDIPWAVVQDKLGPNRPQVVSDPAQQDRLAFLLGAIPEVDRANVQDWQRAAFWLARTDSVQPLQPALFFLAVRPPHRLSYNRLVNLAAMLVTTVVRHRPSQRRDR
jgi:hypothetical protein